MARFLIIAHNNTSAGTGNQTASALKDLCDSRLVDDFYLMVPKTSAFNSIAANPRVKILRLPAFFSVFTLVTRVFYNFMLVPLIAILYRPDFVFVSGNFLPIPIPGAKVGILVRSAYLVDDQSYEATTLKGRIIEFARRLVFKLSVGFADEIIVQSKHMKDLFREKYGPRKKLSVLPNPISTTFLEQFKRLSEIKKPEGEAHFLFYPSRAAPHKNYEYLIDLATRHQNELRKRNVKILLTIQSEYGEYREYARHILSKIQKSQLDDLFENLGEVSQSELVKYYQKSRALIFPSKTESFGNPLIESVYMETPVLAADLSYARNACDEAAQYFSLSNVDEAFKLICDIVDHKDVYDLAKSKCQTKKKQILTNQKWITSALSSVSSQDMSTRLARKQMSTPSEIV